MLPRGRGPGLPHSIAVNIKGYTIYYYPGCIPLEEPIDISHHFDVDCERSLVDLEQRFPRLCSAAFLISILLNEMIKLI